MSESAPDTVDSLELSDEDLPVMLSGMSAHYRSQGEKGIYPHGIEMAEGLERTRELVREVLKARHSRRGPVPESAEGPTSARANRELRREVAHVLELFRVGGGGLGSALLELQRAYDRLPEASK